MNKVESSLLKFFVKFAKNYSEGFDKDEALVEKMIRNKAVQKLVIDCIYKLEPILAGEILNSKRKKTPVKQYAQPQESRLTLLAKEIQNLMLNFDSIKQKLSSVKQIVNSIDSHLTKKFSISEDLVQSEENFKLENFLKKFSQKRKMLDHEFQDFTNETWEKHFEVEKMLQEELILYENKGKMLANKFLTKLNQVKQKTGEKIFRLELKIVEQEAEFEHHVNRLQMVIEEKNSQELRKVEYENNLLNEYSNLFYIPDMQTAILRIKSLVTIRQILEKNRNQDEKIIQSLKNKIKLLAQEYVESQDKLLKTTQNFSSLSLCIAKIIDESCLTEIDKKSLFDNLNSLDCKLLENRVMDERVLQYLTGKVFINRMEKILEETESKDEGFKIKIWKCLENEARIGKLNKKDSGRKRKASPNGKLSGRNFGTSPRLDLMIEPDSPFDSVKKMVSVLDMELKSRNKVLTQNLTDAITGVIVSPKKQGKEIKVRTHMIDIQIPKLYISVEKSSGTEPTPSTSSTETQTISTFSCNSSQTPLNFSDVTLHESYYTNNNFLSLYRSYIQQIQSDSSTQTEKKPKFKELQNSSLLIKGLMRNSIPNIINTIKVSNEKLMEESAINSTETVPNTEKTPSLLQSKHIYEQELEMFAQFLGYKKLDFSTLQYLWEEVINRRLLEGEKDKITSHLRAHFGAETFVEEKLKVIKLLSSDKSDYAQDKSLNVLLKDFHAKISVIARWRNLLINFFKSNIPKFFNSDTPNTLSKIVFFTRLQNLPNQDQSLHNFKKQDTSIIFKKQDWRVQSKSPILQSKAAIFPPPRIKPNKTYEKLSRPKTPTILKSSKKLPNLNFFK